VDLIIVIIGDVTFLGTHLGFSDQERGVTRNIERIVPDTGQVCMNLPEEMVEGVKFLGLWSKWQMRRP
jgi:hypothetical protein